MNLYEIAQKIVDATMETIDSRNVNIMDCNGFIIASGEKSRINTYHKGADDVIKSGNVVDIYPEDVSNYPGAKQGVNMPVKIEGKTIGVVGVHGHPDEVRIVAKLVKMSVELALEQHLISEQVKLVKDLKQQLLRKLIYEDAKKNEEEILCLSKIAGIDLEISRYAIVFEIIDDRALNSLQLLKVMNRIEQTLIDNGCIDKEDFSGLVNQYYVIFKRQLVKSHDNEHHLLKKICNIILEKFQYRIKITMGSFYRRFEGYSKSFEEAKTLLDIGKESIQNINDLNIQADYMLNNVNSDILEHFVKKIYETLLNHNEKIQGWVIETLEAMFKNNLNIADTANFLNIHKNTMLYRIKKIEEITGLSINTNFNHAVLLKFLIIYIQRLNKV
ncbi:sugar diacid recognition domain-containing protein [Petroclostridium sp. X23]|uniref:CdaR family transcriptional regulator n=1 Tax=Petroclostridium sp. X23 TaxID=3045146 RepID=UPI0024ACC014|nr:sugar diacid recognition domain-containing protein [Petroclostridium sp. X23]WHH58059.1 sugar diacid recognition domain-containing protein [Petroclostridium sp. X23]